MTRTILAAALLALLAGCSNPTIYVVDVVTTKPVTKSDAVGIHIDMHERETHIMPLPIPVKGTEISIDAPGETESADRVRVNRTFSDSNGCASLEGETELEPGAKVWVKVRKRGFKSIEREFELSKLRSLNLTIVMEVDPNAAPEEKRLSPEGEEEAAPAPAPAKSGVEEIGSGN
ncbi:MAG: hypothetical protein ACYS22_02400 [Planctomycetota bacterium]|jgi:hypothetical protein